MPFFLPFLIRCRNRFMALAVLVLWALYTAPLAAQAPGQAAGRPAVDSCAPAAGLHFICGADRPEDLARIPGTRWIIASGFSPGSGLKLVDSRRKTQRRLFDGRADQITRDLVAFPDCATPPDPALFNARGLSLRATGRGRAMLHVVNHGGRESVEVFDILWDRPSTEPRLVWKGCLLMPEGHVGNAVATYQDGTVLVTVLTRPGTTITDFERGAATGGVFQRRPGDAAFQLIPGTELPGNNGLQTARDDREFYVVAFGWRAVAIFARDSVTGPKAVVKAPGFMPDNIHYDGGRLLAAGMVSDEPACGGVRKIIDGVADRMLCPRGYGVAILDPRRRTFKLLTKGPRNPAFNGVSSAIIVGRDLWLGSYQADRIAYRKF